MYATYKGSSRLSFVQGRMRERARENTEAQMRSRSREMKSASQILLPFSKLPCVFEFDTLWQYAVIVCIKPQH